jgi:hypothetical protein
MSSSSAARFDCGHAVQTGVQRIRKGVYRIGWEARGEAMKSEQGGGFTHKLFSLMNKSINKAFLTHKQLIMATNSKEGARGGEGECEHSLFSPVDLHSSTIFTD